MKILLAIDGSPCSQAAVNEVAKRPWPANSELRIVSAFEVPLLPAPEAWAISSEYYDQMTRVAREQAEAVVNAAATKVENAPEQTTKVTTRVLMGSARFAILEESEDWKADLIVVGSHGYGPWQRFLLGSVSQALVSHAKCSVEVVRCNVGSDSEKAVQAA
ncbi:MAG TPA: universal stress protein [Pyrinomonadaceae bacterium]|jgi:nucleotide-binding universal stress UspA family protein